MTTLLAGLLLSTFSFKGGGDAELSAYMSRWIDGSVALLADGRRTWPKTFVADEKLDKLGLLKVVQRKLITTALENLDAQGFSSQSWPLTFYRMPLRSVYQSGFRKASQARPELKQGKISFATLEAPLTISEAFPINARLHWSWHWLFENARLAISSKDLTEKQYVEMIADALGAEAVLKKGAYYFDIEPNAYLERTIALAEQQFSSLRDPAGEKYDYLLLKEVLRTLSNAQVRQLLADPDGKLRITNVRDSRILKVAQQRLEKQYPLIPDDGVKRNKTALAAWNAVKDAIDFTRPISIILYADGMIAVHYPGTSKAPGGVVL